MFTVKLTDDSGHSFTRDFNIFSLAGDFALSLAEHYLDGFIGGFKITVVQDDTVLLTIVTD